MTQTPAAGTEASGVVRVTTSEDGLYAAVVEPDRIVVLTLPELELEAEIGIVGDARSNDVALVGSPPRLLVLSRGAPPRLYVVDPRGPTKLGDIELRAPMRIAAVSGAYALLVGDGPSAAMVDVERRDLVAQPLPTRAAISAAGAFGEGRFIVSIGGLFEEWDGRTRKPARRFQLGRPTVASHVGGNARQIWIVREGQPDKIELVPLSSIGRSRVIDLPEPAERVATDTEGEVVVVVGARTGGLYVADVATRTPLLALDRGRVHDAAWLGAEAIVTSTASGLIELVPATGEAPAPGDALAAAERGDAAAADDDDDDDDGEATADAAGDDDDGDDLAARRAGRRGAHSTWDRVAAWREQLRRRTAPGAAVVPIEPAPRRRAAPPGSAWRDTLAAWTRGVLAGAPARPPEMDPGPPHEVAARLGFDGELTRALWLAYGAHLCGHDGVAPIDVAAVTERRWDEALGGGLLAASGALIWRRSRMRLAPEVTAALDERPPLTGALIEGGAPAATAIAVVAPASAPWADVSAWAIAGRGAVLVPEAAGERRPRRFVLEARVRGAAPLVPWARMGAALGEVPPGAIVVVEDDGAAAALGLEIAARWPAPPAGS